MDLFVFDEILPNASVEFRAQLAQAQPEEPLIININSSGGMVTEGMSIAHLISKHEGPTVAHISGICASISTVIALACNQVVMDSGSLWMVHNALFPEGGNAKEMRRKAELVEGLSNTIRNVYQQKTKLSNEVLSELMDEETLLTADEALKLGFIDEVQQIRVAAKLDLTNLDMSIIDDIKAIGESLKGSPKTEAAKAKSETAKDKAVKEINDKAAQSEDPAEVLTADLVRAEDFIPFRDQVLDFMQKLTEFITAAPTEEQTAEDIKSQVEASINTTLAAIKSKAKAPARSGTPVAEASPNVFKGSKDAVIIKDFTAAYDEKMKNNKNIKV